MGNFLPHGPVIVSGFLIEWGINLLELLIGEHGGRPAELHMAAVRFSPSGRWFGFAPRSHPDKRDKVKIQSLPYWWREYSPVIKTCGIFTLTLGDTWVPIGYRRPSSQGLWFAGALRSFGTRLKWEPGLYVTQWSSLYQRNLCGQWCHLVNLTSYPSDASAYV